MLVLLYFLIYITDVLAIWVLIPRDNSTIVDAANVLGCMRSTGVVSDNTKVYIENNQTIVLGIEYDNDYYRSQNVVKMFFYIWTFYFSIDTAIGKFGPAPVYIGTLSEVTDKWFAIIPRIARQPKREHPFGNQKEKEQKQRFCSNYCAIMHCSSTHLYCYYYLLLLFLLYIILFNQLSIKLVMLVFLCFVLYITDVLAIWELIPRDNSTIVDAANVLGCIRSTNVIGNNTKIYVNDNQVLVLEIEYLIDDYRSNMIVWECNRMFGHSISLMIDGAVGKFGLMPDYIGTLPEVADKWFAIIPRIARMEKIENPFSNQKKREKEREKRQKQNFSADYFRKNKKCPYVFSNGLFRELNKQCSIFEEKYHNGKGKSYY